MSQGPDSFQVFELGFDLLALGGELLEVLVDGVDVAARGHEVHDAPDERRAR